MSSHNQKYLSTTAATMKKVAEEAARLNVQAEDELGRLEERESRRSTRRSNPRSS